jgi:hypothetical protein
LDLAARFERMAAYFEHKGPVRLAIHARVRQ